MNIRLNASRVLALARARGISGRGELALRLRVHRSTVSRWLSATAPSLPGAATQAVALAALLDVDPMVLFETRRRDFARLATAVHRAVRTGDWDAFHPVLEFMGPYFAPGEDWPPPEVAEAFQRPWYTRDLPVFPSIHGIGYTELELVDRRAPDAVPGAEPPARVWHMAFRDTGSAVAQTWRAYGGILRLDGRLRLVSYRGFIMRDAEPAPAVAPADPPPADAAGARIRVQVWVGAQAGVVRIACLHPFNARWVAAAAATGTPESAPAHSFRFCEQGFACVSPEGARCPFIPRCDGAQTTSSPG